VASADSRTVRITASDIASWSKTRRNKSGYPWVGCSTRAMDFKEFYVAEAGKDR
jgi:hypothetical protein